MALEDIVSVAISATSKTPSRPGFGTPLLLVQKVPDGWGTSTLVRTFGSLTELTDLGFAVTDPAYLMAQALKSQNPSPKRFKIGVRASNATRTIKLTVTRAAEGYVYAFKVGTTSISYTVLSSATTTTVATALAALIDADPNVSATSSGAVITVTASAGKTFEVSGFYSHGLTFKDDTADPGIATDLAAINSADPDWYCLLIDAAGELEAVAAAAWVEANKKILVLDNCDSEVLDAGDTDDICSTLKTAAYARTGVLVNTVSTLNYGACAWAASRLVASPGSDTWKFKTLAGVTASALAEGQKAAVLAKKGNTYTTVAGLNITEEGWTASGEFFDTVRFIDWLESEIKVRVFALLANAPKIPYTDAGVDTIVSVIKGALVDGVNAGGLAADPAPEVTAPLVEDIDTTIRATRALPDVEFSGRLAGAVHSLTITGTLSV